MGGKLAGPGGPEGWPGSGEDCWVLEKREAKKWGTGRHGHVLGVAVLALEVQL